MSYHRNTLSVVALSLLTSVVLAGCGSPPPEPGTVYAVREPPPRRTEVIVTRPGPDYAWVAGDWRWNGGDYEWQPGHWQAYESGRRHWAPGHWRHNRQGWYYVQGHWR